MTDTCFGRKPRILVFCRPFLLNDFRTNLGPAADDYEFVYLTDGQSPGVRDTRAAFYAAMADGQCTDELSPAEFDDVIARCRLLRAIDRAQAEKLVNGMAIALAAELDHLAPVAVLSQMVDEYVTHLLSLLAAKRAMRFAGYCYSYFPGYAQLTESAYGTPLKCREPTDDEINQMLAIISQRAFRQNYNQTGAYGWPAHIKNLVRYQVKRLAFSTWARMQRDPWNCHFAMLPYIVERRRFWDYPLRRYVHADWRSEIECLKRQRPGATTIYMPLGYWPESTIDYWIPDRRAIDYEALTLDMVATLALESIVVVKDHIHMMGSRHAVFSKALRAMPSVVSVPPSAFSNDVLAASDAVLLGAGSVGVEATIRGRPVFTFSASSYWLEKSKAMLLDLGIMDQWSRQIAESIAAHLPLTRQEARELIRDSLRGNARTRSSEAQWPQFQVDDLRRVLDTLVHRLDQFEPRLEQVA